MAKIIIALTGVILYCVITGAFYGFLVKVKDWGRVKYGDGHDPTGPGFMAACWPVTIPAYASYLAFLRLVTPKQKTAEIPTARVIPHDSARNG